MTHKFSGSGDRELVSFIYDRLVYKYREPELYDYMHALARLRDGVSEVAEKADKWDRLPRYIKWLFQ